MPLISTYAELQSEVADWMARPDLQSKVTTFIKLAEDKFVRAIREEASEAVVTLALTDGVGDLPGDFGEYRSVNETSRGRELVFRPPGAFVEESSPAHAGQSRIFTIEAGKLRVHPVSDSVRLLYLQGVPRLADAAGGTNWLLTSHSDLYLYASIAEGERYARNPQSAAFYEGEAEKCFTALMAADARKRWGATRIITSELTP